MPEELVMPRLSDTMAEGTIGKWLKQVGDKITKGDVILELQTDKANMELEAFNDGVLDQIIIPEGGTAPVGEPIAIIRGVDEPAGAGAARPAQPTSAAASAGSARPTSSGVAAGEAPAAPVNLPTAPPARPDASRDGHVPPLAVVPTEGEPAEPGRVRASPLARRLAQEMSVDLAQVRGSGPAGRIVREDVEAFAQRRQAQPAPAATAEAPSAPSRPAPTATAPAGGARLVELNRFQQVIARRMAESKAQVPHFYVTSEIDMTAVMQLRKTLNEAWGKEQSISFNDMLAKACTRALLAFPDVNSYWRDGKLERHDYVNIGLAVALDDALLVPNVKDCHRKSMRQIGQDSKVLIEKARAGKLSLDDQTGGTFTISNLGMFDVEEFNAIINQPEAAILAVGSIKPRPVVIDGEVRVSNRMRVTLSCDHRVVYGATAAQFLQEVKRLLEAPFNLVE